jgi:hypothetical protein
VRTAPTAFGNHTSYHLTKVPNLASTVVTTGGGEDKQALTLPPKSQYNSPSRQNEETSPLQATDCGRSELVLGNPFSISVRSMTNKTNNVALVRQSPFLLAGLTGQGCNPLRGYCWMHFPHAHSPFDISGSLIFFFFFFSFSPRHLYQPQELIPIIVLSKPHPGFRLRLAEYKLFSRLYPIVANDVQHIPVRITST